MPMKRQAAGLRISWPTSGVILVGYAVIEDAR